MANLRHGTLGRNVLRGFAARQVDVSVRRNFRLTERASLQVRVDVFKPTESSQFR